MDTHDAEFYQAIVRNIAEGICMVRVSDGTIVYANPRFQALFGYDAGELVGRPVSILNYEEDESSAEAKARSIMAELERHGEATYEVHNRKKDGTPFWCRARTSRFMHPDFGSVWLAVQGDITAEQEAVEQHLELLRRFGLHSYLTVPLRIWVESAPGESTSFHFTLPTFASVAHLIAEPPEGIFAGE